MTSYCKQNRIIFINMNTSPDKQCGKSSLHHKTSELMVYYCTHSKNTYTVSWTIIKNTKKIKNLKTISKFDPVQMHTETV